MIDGDDTTLDQNAPETASTEVENSSPPTDDASSELEQNQEPEEGQTDGDDDSSDDEEFEVNGKRYTISKELKPLLMMQQDYTRKTQEVAKTREELAAERTALTQQAEATKALSEDRKRLVLLDDYLERQSKADWKTLWQEDPLDTPRKWAEYQHWKDQRTEIASKIGSAEQEAALKEERETATRIQEALSEARKIPGWSSEVAQKVEAHATTYGFTIPQLNDLVAKQGAAFIKMAHKAFLADQLISSKQTATKTPAVVAEPIKPLAVVSKGKAPARTGLSDSLSAEEWVKAREQQLRRKG